MRWSWQSNPNPWQENEKEEWTEYSTQDTKTLEDTYQRKGNTVELGAYVIDIQEMFQIHKKDATRVRKIKRTLPKPNVRWDPDYRFNTSLPPFKTGSNGSRFLNIDDFLKNLPPIQPDAPRYTPWDPDYIAFTLGAAFDILMTKNRDKGESSRIQEIKEYILKELNKIIESYIDYASLQAFYGLIFRSFTEECMIYKGLNQAFKQEEPTALEDWKPFLQLLVGGFYINKESKFGYPLPSIVYRGTLMSEAEIKLLEPTKLKNISWNAFISTSIRRTVLSSTFAHKKSSEVAVVFEIQINENTKDLKKQVMYIAPFSSFFEEQEVLFAPGTMFEVLEKNFLKDRWMVKLRTA
jgi:hypothetical protein